MFAHRIETTISQDGLLMLKTLPFHKGEQVEVIILRRDKKQPIATDDLDSFFSNYQADFTNFKFNRDEGNER